ncbi:LamG-like jellyroll fold domain-containing protein [Kitasatospora phosalacinea]|uniref:LamG-like jellyroll fold domain-containing protein n=1 Tax=Kitasatospora phosalacinea TaxID=2065 RepID=A0ABW6GVI3_9ACTN
MQGVNLWAQYHVWDNVVNNGSGGAADASWPSSSWSANGSSAYTNVGFQVSDGHTYGWNVSAQDGTLGSPGSQYCYFSVDLTPPSVPTVTPSAVFPELGGTSTPTGHAGDAATVKVTANDPTPGGCNLATCLSSGITRFEYSMDSNIPGNGALSKPAVQSGGGTATADIPINVSTTQWGTHTLFVRAVDAAGNTQGTVAQYAFFAPWNPAAKVTAGDLTTDGIPDLAAVGISGSLYLVKGNSDPATTPEEASTQATSPDGTSWNNYLVTHRGSATTLVDDLFAFQKNTHQLYLYKNDALSGGTPGHFSLTQKAYPINTSAGCPASGSDGTWNRVTQILAVGTLSGYTSAPDLVTVDNKELWYYPGTKQAGCFLAAGVKIGTGDWSNTTLLAPGLVNGVPTLWARNNVTGAISSFPLTFDTAHQPTTRITAPTRSPLVSGVLDSSGKNLCLDINNSSTDNGTPAQVYTCNGGDAQNATLGTDGSIHLLGKCLDANDNGTANNTAIQLWDCNNTPAQKWVPGPFAGSLLNPNSGRCLADPAASNTLKTQLILWDCLTGNAEQTWAATAPGKALPTAQPLLPIGAGDRLAPAVASPGDVDGDSYPDLYTTSGNGTITRIPGAVTPAAQATDRWQLADTTDSSRTNNLTLNGGATLGADSGRTVLNGNATDGYAASATTSLDTGKSFTVSAWVKLNSLGANSTFVSQSGTSANGFQLYYSAYTHAFGFGRASADDTSGNFTSAYGPTTGATAPATGTWYHLTGSYDATTNQLTLYINGIQAATATYTGTTWNATGPLQIGRRLYQSAYGEYLAGSVSDVQTHNTALSPTSISAIFTGTAQFRAPVTLGTVHQPTDRWRLTDTTDDIRTSNNLTAPASTSFVSDNGRNAKVLSLPGTSDALVSTPGQVIDTTKSYSVSAWAYLTNTNGWSTVVAQSAGSASTFYLQYNKTYNAWTFVSPSNDSASPTAWYTAYAKTPPALNTWTHLVATYDASTQTMSLYVDGKLAATATNPTPLASTGPLTIGSSKTGDYFPGRISDVQTWNSALPPAAVTALNTNQPVMTQLS